MRKVVGATSSEDILVRDCYTQCLRLLRYLLYILNALRCPYVRSYVRSGRRGQLSSE